MTPEEETELRAAWEKIGAWEKTMETGEGEYVECPFCRGSGETEGFILDATNVTPATLGGYGIGDGLRAAELVAKSTGRLLAALDAERAEHATRVAEWEQAEHLRTTTLRALVELQSALAVCPGFKGVATDRVWEALADTNVLTAYHPKKDAGRTT